MKAINPLVRLALGASVGALCGLLALVFDPAPEGVQPGLVASVNGRPLGLEQYQRAVRLYASEKREPVTSQDRTLILERMIEEELLRQYGVESGLVRSDPQVRAEVLRAVMTSLTAQLDAQEASEQSGSDAFAGYLAQLRSGATVRWVVSGAAQ